MREVLVAIISAASALLGVFITQIYESRKRASEEKRRYAEFFLGRKIDALNSLYAALVDCHSMMNFYGNDPPSTMQEFKEKIKSKEHAYLRAKVIASIYLDEVADKTMSNAYGAFTQASMAIWLRTPDKPHKNSYDASKHELDWPQLGNRYEAAVACLKNMLNPQILERFENTKKM
ncbi:MAG: hypothetical protein ACRECP_02740 [Methylocella sp.]